MAVYKEINRADGSGVTTFYRLSNVLDTAETDDQEGQAVVFDYNEAQNKPSINGVTLVGDKTSSDLGLQPAGDYITNDEADAKFIDEDELLAYDYVNETQLEEALANIEHFHREIVNALPVTGKDNVLYMVRKEGSGEDIYNEYIWVGLSNSTDGYEFIGTTATDLTDYYKKGEVNTLLSNKVDKEYGKGLSEQNYTLTEKTKLAGLENYDDTEIQSHVATLSNTVSGLSTTSTSLNNRLTAIEPQVSSNSAAVSTIYDLLDKRMTAIRLVEQGDGWVWMNLEGSRLTYAQASAALGHENCMLFIEQLENDGKVIPAEYKSEGDHINVIFKDLDSLVHIMTCGEDDAIVTEDVTTTDGQVNFSIEDEAVGYGTALDTIYGNTEQLQTTGKNLLDTPQIHTWSGYKSIRNPLIAGTYTISCGKVTQGGANPPAIVMGSTYKYLTNNLVTTVTLSADVTDILFYSNGYNYAESQGVTSTVEDLMISINGGDYEPYTGGQASPSPEYPQEVKTVKGNLSFAASGKNMYPYPYESSTTEINGITFTDNGDGTITANGTATSQAIYFMNTGNLYLPKGGYKFNGCPAGGSTSTYFLELYKHNPASYPKDSGEGGTFYIKENNQYIQFYIVIRSGTIVNNLVFKPMIRKINIEDDTYEPYQGRRYSLSLGSIELCKIGNYQNKIYKQNDAWYLHKDIDKIVLNGQDGVGNTYVSLGSGQGGQKRFKVGNPLFGNVPNNIRTVYADYYQGIPYNGSTSTSNSICQWSDQNMFAITTDSTTMTMSEFKAMLNSNPLTVYYVLENPIDVEIDDPTLLAQLSALEQITQYKNTYLGIIATNNSSIPEADFTYIRNVVINNSDHVLGKDTYWNDEVPTSADLPANAQEGEIRIVQDTEAVYIYDGTDWIPFDKGTEVDLSNYLAKDNTTAWIPTGPFNPATKKYVDDSVSGLHIPTKVSQLQNDSNFVTANVNNLTNYYLKTNTYTKNEVDALIAGGGHAIDIVDDLNQQTSGKVLDAHQGYVLSGRTVPAGGSTGQVLKKESNTDYDTSWTTLAGIPGGGTSGQALVKSSATNYDAAWTTIYTIPTGGTSGQALVKSSNSDYAVTWGNIPNITSGTANPSGGSDGDIYLKYDA